MALKMINTFAFVTGLTIHGVVASLMRFATFATTIGHYYRAATGPSFSTGHEQLAMDYCRKVHCLLPHGRLDGLCTQEHYTHKPLPFQ